ncbi:3-dehydroquinate synthase [Formicincola oecophyllae]|nr:3-dehydroquinate synthase [Formicincola oecophyllae]
MNNPSTAQQPLCVHVKGLAADYDILTGQGLLQRGAEHIIPHMKGGHGVIITDENVAPLHLETLLESFQAHAKAHPKAKPVRLDVLTVPAGERSKSLSRYGHVMDSLLALGIDRRTTILALGGGVVGDLAGFVAATALRGLPFIQLPTTLLSQVDSSVGGKTGLNAAAGKNLIGAFWQPQLVLADSDTLATLPERELKAGYGEIVKSGLAGDKALFEWCEANGAGVVAGDPTLLAEAVRRTCTFKARIVSADEHERNETTGRALLNLGHTFGHAFETAQHHEGALLHGEAVALGLCQAMALAVLRGSATEEEKQRVTRHLAQTGLPTTAQELPGDHGAPSIEVLLHHMTRDKKARDGKAAFVVPHGLGASQLERTVTTAEIRQVLLATGCA